MSDIRSLSKRFALPAARAQWIHITEPDTKFDAQGVYSLQLLMSKEDFAQYIEPLKSIVEEALPLYQAELDNKKGGKKREARLSIHQPWEAEETEDGLMVVKVKRKAVITDPETNLPKEVKVSIIDSTGKFIAPEVYKDEKYGNGTVVRTVVTAFPYMSPASCEVGVSLRLEKVQILEKVTYGDGMDNELGAAEGYTYVGAGAAPAEETDDELGGNYVV